METVKLKMYENKEYDFQKKLEEGNIVLLKQIIRYRESDKKLSFCNFMKLEELS